MNNFRKNGINSFRYGRSTQLITTLSNRQLPEEAFRVIFPLVGSDFMIPCGNTVMIFLYA
jgi:hypothetical protein